jgi:UDP-N-acetyl-D-mannosaminuronic acid dehydrogenase
MKKKIVIIGGSGHVGMPLALKFGSVNYDVVSIDKNIEANTFLNNGHVPFEEPGAEKLLKKLLKKKKILFTDDYSKVKNSTIIIITVDTPMKINNKPNKRVFQVFDQIKNYLRDDHSIILRSTIFPGTMEKLKNKLIKDNIKSKLSYCPERVAQGKSLDEIENLPQIISSENKSEIKKIKKLFNLICKKVVELSLVEAEYSKLFCNAWRYIRFAVTNEFFMLSKEKNFNYDKVYDAITLSYPRNKDLPKQGFAAGPCLPKDALQLWQSSRNHTNLIYNSYIINESLPNFLVKNLQKEVNINKKNIGVLGTTFKAGIDDERASLSIKLIKILKKSGAKVFTYDPYVDVKKPEVLKQLLSKCKIVFIGTPHPEFKKLNLKNKKLIDCWNFIN